MIPLNPIPKKPSTTVLATLAPHSQAILRSISPGFPGDPLSTFPSLLALCGPTAPVHERHCDSAA